MKKIFSLFWASIFTITLFAQLPDGTVVPDFTTTDINGNTFNLYEHLDAGKVVIIDVFATWCGPCWALHSAKSLEKAYCQLGVDGTDDIVVIGIEGDENTGLDDIYGGGTSAGNWADGISYQMADDHLIADLLQVTSYPSVSRICPSDKTITAIGALGVSPTFLPANVFKEDCNPISIVNDVAVLGCFRNPIHCSGESEVIKVRIVNRGSEEVTGLTINVTNAAGTEMFSYEDNETLVAYGRRTIEMGNYILSEDEDIIVELVYPDDNQSNNIAVNYHTVLDNAESNVVTLDLMTDDFGYETYWKIVSVDDNTNIIASGGNPIIEGSSGGDNLTSPDDPGAYESNTAYSETITLPEELGCYYFFMYDDKGDGMSFDSGEASYSLSDNNGVVFSHEDFQTRITHQFSVNEMVMPLSQNETSIATSLKVFPNPLKNQLNVEFELAATENINVTVYNIVGEAIYEFGTTSYNQGNQLATFDVSALKSGMYMVTFRGEDFVSTRKFMVSK